MRYRQVHLDFHTSEHIKDVGKDFSRENFQQMLKIGHVDSITVFSKCHHGWVYHPSKVSPMHPGLDFDLLGAQIEAAHEIGVKTPVYISAGLDEQYARRHPEHLMLTSADEKSDFTRPGYHIICFNTPYLDYLLEQVKEACRLYDGDGIFLDIVAPRMCYCPACIKTMKEAGLNPENPADVLECGERLYAHYCTKVREAIDSVKPGLPVFHNSGHIRRGRRDLAHFNTHLELESLPTGGWGYDHFPQSAAYAKVLDMEYLGMTGKFHTTWGEFGGYKHPNALRYEVALSAAMGAKCSIGDQLHPRGKMDENTYSLIGAAYSELEKKEPWLEGAKSIADVAILSVEALYDELAFARNNLHDTGASRILTEGKYLYHIIDKECDFNNYKVIILPDVAPVDGHMEARLREFVKNGGKILASGTSALNDDKTEFLFDLGAEYVGANKYNPDYIKPLFEIDEYRSAEFIMYSQGQCIKETGTVHALRCNPYFNRTAQHFCSHQHAPVNTADCHPGITEGADGIYISWNIFEDYATRGELICKRAVQFALDKLLGSSKTLSTNLPAQGIVTLTELEGKNICHLLYAVPVQRGSVGVIEDIRPIYDTKVSLKADKAATRVCIVPDMRDIPFENSNGRVSFDVDKFENHAMIMIEY
ncbi:MAG: beta-galactosidase trimerization domain-containing protein [Clostridia bacterium]|nr:beta-galactosidase trimerization domain-containing protein [Clostridia bacterium]